MRRRIFKRTGLAGLLVGAALALSGCWGNVHYWGDGTRNITLTEDISARIIWTCTAEHGAGAPRAFCALDRVHALCYGLPIGGTSESDCDHISSYGEWESMDRAIQHVIGNDDCMSFFVNTGNAADDFWGSVFRGFASCK